MPTVLVSCGRGAPVGAHDHPRGGACHSTRQSAVLVVRFVALPRSGWQTVLKLTCSGCGTNPSPLERKTARAHQIGEAK
eukprot:CAMPEP_0180162180 /NCGR_PEP_ID=MMETSP0986-20121125/29065_1 /TAXON_ID=697907 /ORGANISM="non described non described, Strain CCMP2293" /LENGTH=78 /DNA_ID=CAMNT_0022112605 /DNA_START=319 /DNA_END=555 /DNA_ORIENTATION=+